MARTVKPGKYGLIHVGKNGPATCDAEPGKCLLGGFHSTDEAEVEKAFHEQQEKENGKFGTVEKKTHVEESKIPTPKIMNRDNSTPKPMPPKPQAPKPVPPRVVGTGNGARPVPTHPRASQAQRKPLEGRVPGPYLVFHKDIGFPDALPVDKIRRIEGSLTWGKHAIDESKNDRYGGIDRVKYFKGEDWELIEVKINKTDGSFGRALFRSKPDDRGLSTCMVITQDRRVRGGITVVTAWLNEANDSHKTLRREKYDNPKMFNKK